MGRCRPSGKTPDLRISIATGATTPHHCRRRNEANTGKAPSHESAAVSPALPRSHFNDPGPNLVLQLSGDGIPSTGQNPRSQRPVGSLRRSGSVNQPATSRDLNARSCRIRGAGGPIGAPGSNGSCCRRSIAPPGLCARQNAADCQRRERTGVRRQPSPSSRSELSPRAEP